ncbi:MAG: type II secretion system protein [Candidatus Tectomicrobia bacterium]|uniref:Type II secretion system protein n=1 Tax=Tectimicrobiota bacterium TaxID=2528274 RepID=A0A932MLP1_UNCTE|nr:type II secretion system protein [Candidatus Tectomicrobia bacterium]
MRGSRREEGFTLIELMVALVIISLVAAVTFRLQYQGFRVYERTSQLTDAVLLAQEKLSEAQISAVRAGRGSVRAASGGELFWEVLVTATRHPGVHSVLVRVRPRAAASPILEVSTYVADP